jgi:DNA repair protein RadC
MRDSYKRKRIIDLPPALRPREKLIANGRDNVTTAELLAILFSTGTAKSNALALGETVLRKYPQGKLTQLTLSNLTIIPGIGTSKATRLLAALELGQRLFSPTPVTKVIIKSPKDTVQIVKKYADKKQEYLLCLYINARNELIQMEIIGIGSLNSLQIEPREIFRPAFSTPCAGIIIVHNHPSGDPTPSDDDIIFTKRIQEAGKVIGIPLLDHIIISSRSYYSIKENKTNC